MLFDIRKNNFACLFSVNNTINLSHLSQFYQQTNGVAMGGPVSSTTAEIYM